MIKIIYDLLILIPLSASISALIMPRLYPDVPTLAFLAVTVLSSVYAVLVRRLSSRGRMILAGISVTAVLGLVFAVLRFDLMPVLTDNKWIASVIASTVISIVFLILTDNDPLIRALLGAVGLFFLIVSVFTKISVTKTAVVSIVFLALVCVMDLIHKKSRKDGDTDPAKHLVFTASFAVIVLLAISLIKTPDHPYDWGFVRSAAQSVQSFIARISDRFASSGWDSDEPVIGFSDRAGIGGNLTGKGYPVLDLRSSGKSDEYLYLSGKTFDTFDGRNWTGDKVSSFDGMGFDALETISAIEDAVGDKPLTDLAKGEILIEEYTGLGDAHIFTPEKALPDITNENNSSRMKYYRLNRSSEVFLSLVTGGHTVNPESWERARSECMLSEDPAYDLSNYEAYKKEIYEMYLPVTVISPTAQMYIHEKIGDLETPYERLEAIADALSRFKYTDSPGPLPDDIDDASSFLDYVLFEKKEGYCSYYATSFVIMARALGIPAKYVQGYHVKMGDKLHVQSMSTDAHAWPEAYIDGIGWLIFEPTPGIRTAPSGWSTSSALENKYDYYKEHELEKNEDTGDTVGNALALARSVDLSFIIWPVVIGAGFTLLLLAIDQFIRRWRYNRLSQKDKAIWHCRRHMQRLRRKKMGIGPSETLREYKERLKQTTDDARYDFLDIYEKLLYSDCNVADDEFKSLLFRM